MNKVKCLLFAILVASLVFVGCGKNTDDSQTTENTQIINTESESNSENVNDTETESSEMLETEATETQETETQETEEETETESESETESETEEDDEEEEEEDKTYTYTDMNKVMYATSSCNIRSLPSTNGSKVGSLSKGEAVHVTGVCNETGWYRFEYNGADAYVSPSYLSEDEPKEEEDQPSDPSELEDGEMMTVEEDGKTYEYYNWNGHIVRMLQSTPQARKNLCKSVAYANYGELIVVDGYAASKWKSSPTFNDMQREFDYLESLGYTNIDYSDNRWSWGGPYTYINMYKIGK